MKKDLAECVNKQPGENGVEYLAGLSMLKGTNTVSQKWYWISEQNTDEVLIIQSYNSYAIRDKRPWGAPYSDVQLVGKEDRDVRYSVKARCIAIW
jgi:hypothetical protein